VSDRPENDIEELESLVTELEDTLERHRKYVVDAIEGFTRDKPDTDFQRGYLTALETVAREAMKISLPHHHPPFKSTP
jgi:hypothetical protein